MTKTTATVMLIIFIAVLAFVGVFTFIPEFEYGAYGEFYSPATLIQKDNLFTDTLTTTYSVKLDEGVTGAQVKKIISQRLGSIYGLYGANISTDNSVVSVTVPELVKSADNVTASAIMEVVTVRGDLEILTETTYSKENVILSSKHFVNATTRKLVSGEYDYFVAIVNLNDEGVKAAKSLGASSGTYAIDGNITLTGGVQLINESTLYLYGYTMTDAKELAGYINSGVLGAELKLTDSVTTENNGDLFLFIGLAVLVVALAVFYVVRYKTLGLVGILSQLFTIVVGTIVAGLIHLEILNIFAIVGMLLGIALQTYFTVYAFENINAYEGSTFASAKHKGFANSNKRNLIVHAIALVVGIILWVIPTAVTAPLGNVLVYLVVLSFVTTMGLNRLFATMVEPFIEGAKSNRK
ncbi:MAG: hypothetical protein IJX23_03185 [Clostridia bacterium]|nr:hypothetical protein [Clostridia bacterium]